MIAAAARHQRCFSMTARQDRAVRRTIATIDDGPRTAIKHTDAIFDEDQQRWISDAEVADVPYSAFSSKPKAQQVTARLIVRRVKDINPANQSELFTAYRYHAVFTNSPAPMLAAGSAYRGHAVAEQVMADAVNSTSATSAREIHRPLSSSKTAPVYSIEVRASSSMVAIAVLTSDRRAP